MSPVLFNIYIGSVINSLKLSDSGCHINGVYIGCLVYADDIFLVSASVGTLQKVLDIVMAAAQTLLSETKQEISYPLFVLLRKSLDDASVPEDCKFANICPIFKKGNRNLPEDYRPVSLTSQICKIFEAVIRDAVVHHLESNCLIKDSQHSFRKGYSSLTNMLTFLEKVTGLVDIGSPVDAVFLDLARAFDKVPHQRLVSKLLSHGTYSMGQDRYWYHLSGQNFTYSKLFKGSL